MSEENGIYLKRLNRGNILNYGTLLERYAKCLHFYSSEISEGYIITLSEYKADKILDRFLVIWMIMCDDIAVGYIGCTYTSIDNGIFISEVYIHDQYRRKGYCKQAIHLCINMLRSEFKPKTISLHVLANNNIARNIYLNIGFKPINELMQLKG